MDHQLLSKPTDIQWQPVETAIGGQHSDRDTNTLLSLSQDKPDISQQKWLKQLPPTTYSGDSPAVATTNTSLIVAGGWGTVGRKTEVEVMDTQTLQWSTVASLPLPLSQATATIFGDRLYLGGGFSSGGATKSVLECEVKDLLQSQPPSLASRIGLQNWSLQETSGVDRICSTSSDTVFWSPSKATCWWQ